MKLLILSLFSILVSSCITVPRIQKKDAKNNQFSNDLQTWFYVAHPQKIDTGTKIKSDTTVDTIYSRGQIGIYFLPDNLSITDSNWHIDWDGINTGITLLKHDSTERVDTSFIYDPISPRYINIKFKTDTIYIRRTIHDSIFITKTDQSQANALNTQLRASRDSVNSYMIKYAEEKSTAANRLTWLIILGVALALSGFFNFKTLFKI